MQILCGATEAPETTEGTTSAEAEVAGVAFKVVVTDLDGTETTFEYASEAETAGEALVAVELIEGHDTEYGLYVDAVNGITADWATENAYWAFLFPEDIFLCGGSKSWLLLLRVISFTEINDSDG